MNSLPPSRSKREHRVSNKAIVVALAHKTWQTKPVCRAIYLGLMTTLSELLATGDPVVLHGFGRFTVRTRKGRTRCGKYEPESRWVSFKAARQLKATLNSTSKLT